MFEIAKETLTQLSSKYKLGENIGYYKLGMDYIKIVLYY